MIKKNLASAKALGKLARNCRQKQQSCFGSFKRVFNLTPLKKTLAFSLIELMISLIVISTVTAAFTPVITKKLKSSGVTIGGLTSGNPFENVKLGKDECSSGLSALGVTIVNNNCTMCKLDSAKPACLACSDMSCTASQFENTPDCTCQNCSATFDSKCYKCDIKGCKICSAGYYLEGSGSSATCKEVGSYPGCDSNQCYTDPEGTPPVVKPTPCPDGSICDGGIKTDCVTPELTHKLCSGGAATECPAGKKCDEGKPSDCSPHKMCSGGIEQNCPEGQKCDGGIAINCSLNKKCSGGVEQDCGAYKLCTGGIESDCPNGKKCSGGAEYPCGTNKLCSGGIEQTCPNGSICSNGIATPCTTPELTHKLCSNGVANTCTAGYICNNGIRSTNKCTGAVYCINGIQQNCSSKTANCTACNVDTGVCTSCNSGYYKTGSNTCATCSSAMTGCTTCSSGSSCTRCTGSYYLNGTKCSGCPSYASCNGTGSWSCTGGYFKSGSSCLRCSSYITGCSTCTSSSNCTSCTNAYNLSGGRCALKCTVSGCAACTSGSTTVCATCNTNYTKVNGKCISNSDTGSEMSAALGLSCGSNCLLKINGYYVMRCNIGDCGFPSANGCVRMSPGMAGTNFNGSYSGSGACTNTPSNGAQAFSYSGCSRTVCKQAAAENACAAYNSSIPVAGYIWRLPTGSEASSWHLYLGATGLHHCFASGATTPLCGGVSTTDGYCGDNQCQPHYLRAQGGVCASTDGHGAWGCATTRSFSARCILVKN